MSPPLGRMTRHGRPGGAVLLVAVLAGCVDAQPVSPDFEQRLFNLFGGLKVGEVLTLTGPDAQSIVLEGGDKGARYLFVPFLAADEGSVRLRVRVSGEDLDVLESRSAPRALAPDRPWRATAPLANREEHLRLREWERQRASEYLTDPRARVVRRSTVAGDVSQRATVTPPDLGQTVDLRVIDRSPENPDLCSNPLLRTGRVTAVTEHAILVEDTLNPVSLSPADVQRIADEYERLVYPVAVENFAEPTDIDGNGRVFIFMTSALNESAERAGGGITVGFTFALDLLPRSSSAGSCEASNEGEIFYLIAPDPEGELGIEVSEALVQRLATSIIVHELQHMISSGRRFYEVPDAREFEELWLNEGLSHIAEELVFYAATGLHPRSDLGWRTLTSAESIREAYERFVRDNISIYSNYLSSPENESLMGKSRSDDDFTTRGASWAFLRYLADQTPSEDAELFRSLVNSPVGGVENLERVLEIDPLTWMQRWTVSNFADNIPPEERIGEMFTQPSWDFRSIFEAEIGSLPLNPERLEPGDTLSVTLRGGGSSYIVLQAASDRQAEVNTTRGGSPADGEYRASVVRLE